jgi:hypothetical protein
MRSLLAVILSALTLCALTPPAAASEAEDWQAVKNAEGQGRVHQDPDRRALRQAVLNAASRVESSPCDTQQRQKLSEVFETYKHGMEAPADDKIETFTLKDGRVLDLTQHFNDPAEDAWRFAFTSTCKN